MIAYGDPRSVQPGNAALQALEQRARHADLASLDDTRALLVETGKLEQAISDLPSAGAEQVLGIRRLTDLVAVHFCNLCRHAPHAGSFKRQRFVEQLHALRFAKETELTIKTPEGFEFYALYPEQYRSAAKAWLKTPGAPSNREVLVIGVRSIGTTLSAVVAAALQESFQPAVRFTIRPTGNPYDRTAELPPLNAAGFSAALVVDEGPGQSGSSMAAVAQALKQAGVRRIAFLPGHARDPGQGSSPSVRQCWVKTPRFVASANALSESLAAQTPKLLGTTEPFDCIEDLSAGQWRRAAFADEADWPAACPPFERHKIRCSDRNGHAVLWKFAGLGGGAEAACQRLRKLSAAGFTSEPLGTFRGHIALPWIDGPRLTRADADASVLHRIAGYVLAAAKPVPGHEEHEGIPRLAEMLYWNTKELLGNEAAEQTRSCVSAAPQNRLRLAYGDGRLAPWEWVRTGNGILKTDAEGHDRDHTVIGRQSLLWDIAGVVIEWDLDERAAAHFLEPFHQQALPTDSGALRFFEMAYAAFRLGMLSFSGSADEREQARVEPAENFYREKLKALLSCAQPW